ncbi:MAG: GatB/YqeY domain-containing protein [Anaerolineaceae bacterium]|nr:MAG: GatB/YqeY domain-containing protein [Anaerolineaceae bacterium]
MQDPRPALADALKAAMKNKDSARRDVIRNLNGAIKQAEIDGQHELSAEDVVAILQKEAKKRRESIDEYGKAGRDDLVAGEQAELVIIEEFLPQQMDEAQVIAIVQAVIAEVGATSPADMGKVMGPVMAQVKGVADGKMVNRIVKEQLG